MTIHYGKRVNRSCKKIFSFDLVILAFRFAARLQSPGTGMSMAGEAWEAQEREP